MNGVRGKSMGVQLVSGVSWGVRGLSERYPSGLQRCTRAIQGCLWVTEGIREVSEGVEGVFGECPRGVRGCSKTVRQIHARCLFKILKYFEV